MMAKSRPLSRPPIATRWPPLTAGVLGLFLLLAAGCTVTEVEPRAVEEYPGSLFEETTTTTAEPVVESPEYQLSLFFVDGNKQLVLVQRPRNDVPRIQDVLDKLNEGPSEDERELHDQQIKSELVGLALEPVHDSLSGDGLLTVSVSTALRNLSTDEAQRRQLIVNQIACSLLHQDERVTKVQLADEEGPVSFPGPDTSPIDVATLDVLGGCKTAQELAQEAAEATTTTAQGEGGEEGEGG